jgi:hypothetical protein
MAEHAVSFTEYRVAYRAYAVHEVLQGTAREIYCVLQHACNRGLVRLMRQRFSWADEAEVHEVRQVTAWQI